VQARARPLFLLDCHVVHFSNSKLVYLIRSSSMIPSSLTVTRPSRQWHAVIGRGFTLSSLSLFCFFQQTQFARSVGMFSRFEQLSDTHTHTHARAHPYSAAAVSRVFTLRWNQCDVRLVVSLSCGMPEVVTRSADFLRR